VLSCAADHEIACLKRWRATRCTLLAPDVGRFRGTTEHGVGTKRSWVLRADSALLRGRAPAEGEGLCCLFPGAVVYTAVEEESGLQRTRLCSYPFCADVRVAEE